LEAGVWSAGLARQWCAIRVTTIDGVVRRHVECVCERCVLGSAGDSYYYYSGLVLCWCRSVSLTVWFTTAAGR